MAWIIPVVRKNPSFQCPQGRAVPHEACGSCYTGWPVSLSSSARIACTTSALTLPIRSSTRGSPRLDCLSTRRHAYALSSHGRSLHLRSLAAPLHPSHGDTGDVEGLNRPALPCCST